MNVKNVINVDVGDIPIYEVDEYMDKVIDDLRGIKHNKPLRQNKFIKWLKFYFWYEK